MVERIAGGRGAVRSSLDVVCQAPVAEDPAEVIRVLVCSAVITELSGFKVEKL